MSKLALLLQSLDATTESKSTAKNILYIFTF